MNAIEKFATEAKAAGLSYGKYAALMQSQRTETQKIHKPKKGDRKCIICGNWYTPGITKSGNISTKQKCPKCCEEIKQAYEVEKGRTTTRQLKEYHRVCSECGAEVITTQAPRKDIPIYCLECREKMNKKRQEEYRKKRKGIENYD